MEYDPELHSLECPKCGHGMERFWTPGSSLITNMRHCWTFSEELSGVGVGTDCLEVITWCDVTDESIGLR